MKPTNKETTIITKRKKVSDKARGSQFIGVSKNTHNKWQIIFKYNMTSRYLCSVPDIDQAAILHDLTMISIKGLQAKTNFSYNQYELLSILQIPNLMTILK